MRKFSLFIVALSVAMFSGGALFAQDISGDWQGTLQGAAQDSDLRLVVRISKSATSGWSAMLYSIDQEPEGLDGFAVSPLSLQGAKFRFSIDALHASFDGKLSPDGNSITGSWTGRRTVPLELRRATKQTAWTYRLPKHSISFIAVEKDVKLEVLDFGGPGRPMIFLAGLGDTAHAFDQFALNFTDRYHVYGITRRGFGASSSPTPANNNYSADRLGDDILAVIDALKLDRPVLVGHSIAGEELSSVGSRQPEKVAGLVYLDAGYSYAYYDRSRGDFIIDANELRRKLLLVEFSKIRPVPNANELAQELLQSDIPQTARSLQEYQKELQATGPASDSQQASDASPVAKAMLEGEQKYTEICVPILAFFAAPSNLGTRFKNDLAARARYESWDAARKEGFAKAFETGIPSARVVRLPHADHSIWLSNEADVLREMNIFLATLK